MRFKQGDQRNALVQGDLVKVSYTEPIESHLDGGYSVKSLFIKTAGFDNTYGNWETHGDIHIFLDENTFFMQLVTSIGTVGWIRKNYYIIEKIS